MSPPKARALKESMRAFRIGDPNGRYPIFSGEGAMRVTGRWHRRGQACIYASEHYSTAMLEKLAHSNGILPPKQHSIEISIPAGVTYEVVTKDSLPRWVQPAHARLFGASWIEQRRSCILIVPSFVARTERNIVINCSHEQFAMIRPGLEVPVTWDERLFLS